MLLCTYDIMIWTYIEFIWCWSYMMLVILMNVTLVYVGIYKDDYTWWLCFMNQGITYGSFSCLLDCAGLWGLAWALHFRLGKILVLRVLYVDVMNPDIWNVVMTLCWSYSCWYDLMLILALCLVSMNIF